MCETAEAHLGEECSLHQEARQGHHDAFVEAPHREEEHKASDDDDDEGGHVGGDDVEGGHVIER